MRKNILWIIVIALLSCNQQKQKNRKEAPIASGNTVSSDTSYRISTKTAGGIVNSENKASIDVTYGIDISHYQGDEINFLESRKDNLTFVICKATEGLTLTDSAFYSNWKQMQLKQFVKGAYHFYVSADDAVKQAAFFLKVVPTLSKTDLPLIVDVEGGGVPAGQSVSDVQKGLITFLKEIEKATSRKPIIYTDNDTAREYLNNPLFTVYPLWIADYDAKNTPKLPTQWRAKTWLLWQKSDSYHEGSYINDLDVFNGNADAFRVFVNKN